MGGIGIFGFGKQNPFTPVAIADIQVWRPWRQRTR